MKLLDGQTIGIDLGTTYSALAQLNAEGQPISIPNSDGHTTTPSIVLLGEQGHVIVGPSPERVSVEPPGNIVEAIKRQMGSKTWFKEYQGKRLTPEFVSALILKKLKQDCERTIGPIANAVITVPYYFNDLRRKATQDAGRIAGLNVIDIINEPTAATLAYAWMRGELGRTERRDEEKTIMVYDLGGGTFDVTVVSYTPTHFRVLATDGDVMLGGIDWTNRIVEHLAEQFRRKHGADPLSNPETRLVTTQDCENAKRKLSKTAQTPVELYYEGKSLTVAVTRGDFERMTNDLLQRTCDTTELVLQQSGIELGKLDEVVLVGGSTHMPAVFNMLKEITGHTPSRELDPDEAVAQGAAIHAAILEAKETGGSSRMAQAVIKRLRSVTASDVNSHSLGVEITDTKDRRLKSNHIMIPRNTTIPYTVSQRFTTNVPNQQRIRVRLLQGEVPDVTACAIIGDFTISDLPANLPAGSPVELTYSYEADGRIRAEAKELTGGRRATTEIVRDGGVSDAGLDAFQALAREYQVD
ncbi:MAG: Hsp70 family protein [Planctomycetaceae bacterium]|nr:Hsp70 family protein [Planctomycetaceae bacterium]